MKKTIEYPTLYDLTKLLMRSKNRIRSSAGICIAIWVESGDWGVSIGPMDYNLHPINHDLQLSLQSNCRQLARMAIQDLKEQVTDRL